MFVGWKIRKNNLKKQENCEKNMKKNEWKHQLWFKMQFLQNYQQHRDENKSPSELLKMRKINEI